MGLSVDILKKVIDEVISRKDEYLSDSDSDTESSDKPVSNVEHVINNNTNNDNETKLTYPKTINYMDGISYNLNSILTLRMIAASYIRGEPLYYKSKGEGKMMFDDAIKNALEEGLFKEVIDLSIELREKYGMRLNPQVIIMAVAMHPKRIEFNQKNPKLLREGICKVAKIPTDILTQFEYYKEIMGNKNKLPGVVKRAWADYFEKLEAYQAAKYLNKGKLNDLIKICHADPKKNKIIDEIVKDGKVNIEDSMKTWENLRSAGKNWSQIFDELTTIPHMALVRNLCGISQDSSISQEFIDEKIVPMLIKGVKGGKLFPFQYHNAYRSLTGLTNNCSKKLSLIKAIEDCLQKSIEFIPILKGYTISLCDNSGSARNTFISEYGSAKISDIANLSGLITALRGEKGGKVGVFGDKLNYYNVDKNRPILEQLEEINKLGDGVGQNTENGIWIHFRMSCLTREHYDNIFIYSDMQAGHGNLYGMDPSEYSDFIYKSSSNYIDVMKLISTYRQMVNPKVNVFSVQVAGYDNSLTPENTYRTSIMQGWTGKEVLYANELINIWDNAENNNTDNKSKI